MHSIKTAKSNFGVPRYDVDKTIRKLRQSTLPDDAVERLAEILRTGRNVNVTIPSTST